MIKHSVCQLYYSVCQLYYSFITLFTLLYSGLHSVKGHGVTFDLAVVTLNFKILQFLHVIKIPFLAISHKVKVVGS